jgi:hypothetical protein
VPVAAGIIAGIGNLDVKFSNDFSIGGIAAGTLITLIGFHLMRWLAPAHMREERQAGDRAYEGGAMISAGNVETAEGRVSPYREDELLGDDALK